MSRCPHIRAALWTWAQRYVEMVVARDKWANLWPVQRRALGLDPINPTTNH